MQPFTKKTLQVLVLIIVLFTSFYFVNIKLHPLLNIGIKSILITIIYIVIVYKMNISEEVNSLLNRYIK